MGGEVAAGVLGSGRRVAPMGGLGHFYAQRRVRRVGQLVGDGFVVLWVVLWAYLGRLSAQTFDAIADPVRDSRDMAATLATQISDAAERAGRLPGVGEELRQPFDDAAQSVQGIVGVADAQVAAIERTALLLGWLIFLIPVLVLLVIWLPARIGFYRRARAAQQFLDAEADLDLFALRAMVAQPMHVIAKISDDPVAAWRRGDRDVITALAAVELRRSGLEPPVL